MQTDDRLFFVPEQSRQDIVRQSFGLYQPRWKARPCNSFQSPQEAQESGITVTYRQGMRAGCYFIVRKRVKRSFTRWLLP